MLEAVPLLVVTGILLSIFTAGYARLQLSEIRANWQARRCDPFVISMAHMVPEDPAVDPSQFAADNFKFCLNNVIDGVVGFAMKPVLGLFQEQAKMTEPLQNVMNNLRGAATSLLGPLTQIFDSFFTKFKMIGQQFARIFFKMMSAFDRVFGILVASVFAGLSLIKGVQNFIGFVIQVCIIIIVILSILVIWLWFVMWPVVPIILLAIGFISTTVYAANVSGLSGSFCVAPGTLVAVKGGGGLSVEKVVPGTVLEDGSVVEGILMMTGKEASLVSLYGVTMSTTHLVLYNKRWIPASSHPDAQRALSTPAVLFCLNTTSRTWKVYSTVGLLALRDWEELPDGYDKQWEDLIRGILKGEPTTSPGRPLFGPGTRVLSKTRGEILMSDVHLGEEIFIGDGEWTSILGIVKDTSEQVPVAGPNKAVWRLTSSGRWGHGSAQSQALRMSMREGVNLIVSAGYFQISTGEIVRDFTEIGADQIYKTYEFTDLVLSGVCGAAAASVPTAATSSPLTY